MCLDAWNHASQALKSGSGGGATRTFDAKRSFDDLRRLIQQEEGVLASGSITTRSRRELWTRDVLGFTTLTQLGLNGDNDFTDTGEWDDIRAKDTGSEKNLLKTRDVNADSTPDYTLTYDANDNLLSDGQTYSYVYDAWCRLVYVKNLAGTVTIAKYTYNGLGMRISEQTDTNRSADDGLPDGVVDSWDSTFFIANDLHGRRVATFRASESNPKETFIWHPMGVQGPTFKGGPLLRDRNSTLGTNPEDWDDDAAGGTRAERIYYCTDYQGSVVALVGADGKLKEQVRYSATGVPYGIPLGDVDSDGLNNSTTGGDSDYDVITVIMAGAYDVRGDLDLDGDVDSADRGIAQGGDGEALGRGQLSAPAIASLQVGINGQHSAFGAVWLSASRWVNPELSVFLNGTCANTKWSVKSGFGVKSCSSSACISLPDRLHPDPLLDCAGIEYDPSEYCCVGGVLVPVASDAPGVQLCIRPLQVFIDVDPYCVVLDIRNAPANHCYLWFPGWSGGFQDDSTVWTPERILRPTDRICWPQPRRREGTLPNGTPCRCASVDAIRECIKSKVPGPHAPYNFVTNNCCHWALASVADCCMDTTHPGFMPSPFGTYPPNPRSLPTIWR